MGTHGWRLYGVVGIIFAYIVGLLVLSAMNLQTSKAFSAKSVTRYNDINKIKLREVGILGRTQSIEWCTPLHFLDVTTKAGKDGAHTKGTAIPNHHNTSNKAVDTANPGYAMTALASFPGSGNTWLRYLLQQSTGIYTGSIYKDYGLLKSGFPAESICNQSVLVVKTHEWGPRAWSKFDKAILLIRDPDKAILAEFNRQSGGHIGFASPDRYKRTRGRFWQQFVANKLIGWENMNLSWAKNFTGRLKIVYYDDLVADVETVLRDILHFLTVPIDEKLIECTMKRKEGIYRRKRRLLSFKPFSQLMLTHIRLKKLKVFTALGRQIQIEGV